MRTLSAAALADAAHGHGDEVVDTATIAHRLRLSISTARVRLDAAEARGQLLRIGDARRRLYRWGDVLAVHGIARPTRRAGRAADLAREAAIVEARHAGKTLAEIGAMYGVTRERIRQILEHAAARVGQPIGRRCADCGELLVGRAAKRGLCRDCARRRGRARTCRRCGIMFRAEGRERAYCPACRTETRPCASCGLPVTRHRGRAKAFFRNRLWFCDRRCHGRWLSAHSGRSRAPARPRAS